MGRRIFTPRTARECAISILPVARLMCRLFREMDVARADAGGPDEPVARDYFVRIQGALAAIDRIEAAGAMVQDPRAGFLDFPAVRGGRSVLLCWWIGEPTVSFWHDEGEGFGDRRRVDEEGPWGEPPAEPAEPAGAG